MTLAEKRALALERIEQAAAGGRLAVAFSGGVDSALLLALASEALGPARVLAVTARSASLAEDELAACERIARALGVELRVLETRELERAEYLANGRDRCFHCKDELFARIGAELPGVAGVVYGATADDLSDHRPGMRAAAQHGVRAPLLEAGLGKGEVRALSRALSLETWDKPAQPCLASRIPYGQQVSVEKLAQVEAAERLLRAEGFRELRVRHHEQPAGALARLEVAPDEVSRLLDPALRARLTQGLRALGFLYVTLDLEGFRSGRLNEVAPAAPPLRSLPVLHA